MKDHVHLVCQRVVKNYPNLVEAQETCHLWFQISLNFCMQNFFTPKPATKSAWQWFQNLLERLLGSDSSLKNHSIASHNESFLVQPYNLTVGRCQKIMHMAFDDFLQFQDKVIEVTEVRTKIEVHCMELFLAIFMAVIFATMIPSLVQKLSSFCFSLKFPFKKEMKDASAGPIIMKTIVQDLLADICPEVETPCEMLEDVNANCLDVIKGISELESESASSISVIDTASSLCLVATAPSDSETKPKYSEIIVRMNSRYPELFNKTKVIKEMRCSSAKLDEPPADTKKLPIIQMESTIDIKDEESIIDSLPNPISLKPRSLTAVKRPTVNPPQVDSPEKLEKPSRIPSISKIPSGTKNIVDLKPRPKTYSVESDQKSLLRPPQIFKNPRRST